MVFLLLQALMVASPASQATQSQETPAVTSICEVRAHPEQYVGQIVTVSARYKTDSMHYEFLEDATCKQGSTLELGHVVPERDGSVAAFESAERDMCRRRKAALCILEGTVTIRGQIATSTNAHLYFVINPYSVLSYTFDDER